LAFALAGCKSEGVDGGDLHSVFEGGSAASGSASTGRAAPAASSSADAGPRIPPRERQPIAGPCVAPAGTPAVQAERTGGRPACRRTRILEHRDAGGTPRYACVYEPSDVDARKPLPLLVFLHSEYDTPAALQKKTRLRTRQRFFDLSGDPRHQGFVVLAPQARRLGGALRWDVDYTAADNLDARSIDHDVDQLLAEGLVDPRQIYAIGESRGGVMAALYAMLRPDRVAAYGVFAADAGRLAWSCDGAPTPAAVLYRACDTVVPCADVEQWLRTRERSGAPTYSLRLGVGKAEEPSCVLSEGRCLPNAGTANHQRWPAPREGELLEYLGRYSLDLEAPARQGDP
jgi:poly(3-hydroxybutyrate) depolymerase